MSSYFLYARKSSESEDRQALSIESQIRELTDYARGQNIAITAVLSESRSAKTPGRPVFGELMRRLAAGEATGILCWKLDRLARNPIDGGQVIWAIDQGTIQNIAVPGKSFGNRGDDKFWMQLEFGMAKKYVDDLSDNTKRGIRAKLEQGWLPGKPPLGYMNDLIHHTIVPDQERFPIVQRIWHSILGGQAPVQVFARLSSWGLLTRRTRVLGNKMLTLSGFYRIITNPFYHGLITRKGEAFPGKHLPMISKDEFDRVQEILGRPNRPPYRKHTYPFVRLIRCGECGCTVTAEEVTNRHGKHYRYYHCSRRRVKTRCSQPGIRAEVLESQVRQLLSSIEISDSYSEWATETLRLLAYEGARKHKDAHAGIQHEYDAVRKKAAELLRLRLDGLLTDGEFLSEKHELANEELRLRVRIEAAQKATRPAWLDSAEMCVAFANQAPRRFADGSGDQKREILLALGTGFTLKDQTLLVDTEQPFRLLSEGKGSAVWGDCHPTESGPEVSGVLPESLRGQNREARFQAETPGVGTQTRWGGLDQARGRLAEVLEHYRQHPPVVPWPRFCRVRSASHSERAS